MEYGLYPFLMNLRNNLSGYKKYVGQRLGGGKGGGSVVGMQNK